MRTPALVVAYLAAIVATNWLRKGGRLETLSLILGHASIRTTYDQYAHLDTSDVLADLAIIEGRS